MTHKYYEGFFFFPFFHFSLALRECVHATVYLPFCAAVAFLSFSLYLFSIRYMLKNLTLRIRRLFFLSFFFFFLNNYLLNFDVHKRLSTFSTQIDATKIRHGNSNFAILILRFAIRNTRVNLAKMAHYDWALHLQCTIDKSQFSVNWIPLKSLGFRLALQFEINKSREEEEKRR